MFVPVACLKCAKPFQVPRDAAGTEVKCPWCAELTPALPVAIALTPSPHSTEEPLSLDDALPRPEPVNPPADVRAERPPVRIPYRKIILAVALALVVTAATVAVLGYGEGRIPASAWVAFTTPDGSFTVELPGSPRTEQVEPIPASPVTRGGERFVTSGWYSGTRAWIGWQELDQAWAKTAQADRDDVLTLAVLQAARDRRKAEVGGTVTKEARLRLSDGMGLEVQMDTPRGQLVERYILALDAKPSRLYFLGLVSKNAAPGGKPGPAAERIFTAFRVQERR